MFLSLASSPVDLWQAVYGIRNTVYGIRDRDVSLFGRIRGPDGHFLRRVIIAVVLAGLIMGCDFPKDNSPFKDHPHHLAPRSVPSLLGNIDKEIIHQGQQKKIFLLTHAQGTYAGFSSSSVKVGKYINEDGSLRLEMMVNAAPRLRTARLHQGKHIPAQISELQRLSEGIIDGDPGKIINDSLEILYRWMPQELYEAYYTGAVAVPFHDLERSLEDIRWILMILKAEKENDRGLGFIDIHKIDVESLIFASLTHDLACIAARRNHMNNSSLWAKVILEKEGWDEIRIKKIVSIIQGHEKNNGFCLLDQHKFPEARLLYDADSFSTILKPQKIVDIALRLGPQDGIFFNPDLILNERKTAIFNGSHDKSPDKITDIFIKYYRGRMPFWCLTQGGRIILREMNITIRDLHEFIDQRVSIVRGGLQLSDQNIVSIHKIYDELDRVLVNNEDEGLRQTSSPIIRMSYYQKKAVRRFVYFVALYGFVISCLPFTLAGLSMGKLADGLNYEFKKIQYFILKRFRVRYGRKFWSNNKVSDALRHESFYRGIPLIISASICLGIGYITALGALIFLMIAQGFSAVAHKAHLSAVPAKGYYVLTIMNSFLSVGLFSYYAYFYQAPLVMFGFTALNLMVLAFIHVLIKGSKIPLSRKYKGLDRYYSDQQIKPPYEVQVHDSGENVLFFFHGMDSNVRYVLEYIAAWFPQFTIVIVQNLASKETINNILRNGINGKSLDNEEDRAHKEKLERISKIRSKAKRTEALMIWIFNYFADKKEGSLNVVLHSLANRRFLNLYNPQRFETIEYQWIRKEFENVRHRIGAPFFSSMPFGRIFSFSKVNIWLVKFAVNVFSRLSSHSLVKAQIILRDPAVHHHLEELIGKFAYRKFVRFVGVSEHSFRDRAEAMRLFRRMANDREDSLNVLAEMVKSITRFKEDSRVVCGDKDPTTPPETNIEFAKVMGIENVILLSGLRHDCLCARSYYEQIQAWLKKKGLPVRDDILKIERQIEQLTSPFYVETSNGRLVLGDVPEGALFKKDAEEIVAYLNALKGFLPRKEAKQLPGEFWFKITKWDGLVGRQLTFVNPLCKCVFIIEAALRYKNDKKRFYFLHHSFFSQMSLGFEGGRARRHTDEVMDQMERLNRKNVSSPLLSDQGPGAFMMALWFVPEYYWLWEKTRLKVRWIVLKLMDAMEKVVRVQGQGSRGEWVNSSARGQVNRDSVLSTINYEVRSLPFGQMKPPRRGPSTNLGSVVRTVSSPINDGSDLWKEYYAKRAKIIVVINVDDTWLVADLAELMLKNARESNYISYNGGMEIPVNSPLLPGVTFFVGRRLMRRKKADGLMYTNSLN